MLFSSITFLYYFLPWALLFYFLSGRYKNLVLFLTSLVFYAWGEPIYVFLMVFLTGIGYVFGILAEKYRESVWKKYLVGISVAAALFILGYFKYADFVVENVARVTGSAWELPGIVLPIGISFYTFQMISYVIDVGRGQKAQKNFISLAAYIAMFPQLVAGPIVRYSHIEGQLEGRIHSGDKIAGGMMRFVVGLSKKVVVANTLGELTQKILDSGQPSILLGWLFGIAGALQIYFDFSGYSDMAIGLGEILGFHFPENFNYPFISRSVAEFWRRWHMSLGNWFRDYLYIPLGGSRVSFPKYIRNICLVWLATGIWHGAAWNFVFWGLFFVPFFILEKLWLGKKLENSRILSRCYLLFVIIVSFLIFRVEHMKEVLYWTGMMFGRGVPFSTREALFFLKDYGGILILAVFGCTPGAKHLYVKMKSTETGAKVLDVLLPVCLGVMLFIDTAYLVNSSYNPFLYFRF